MPVTLTIRDETTAGAVYHERPLEFSTERITVRALIRERVYQEVQDHNRQHDPEVFRGLVQPADADRLAGGQPTEYRLKTRRVIDWKPQFEQALAAFDRSGFFILIDDRQAENLDDEFTIARGTVVSFVKLTPSSAADSDHHPPEASRASAQSQSVPTPDQNQAPLRLEAVRLIVTVITLILANISITFEVSYRIIIAFTEWRPFVMSREATIALFLGLFALIWFSLGWLSIRYVSCLGDQLSRRRVAAEAALSAESAIEPDPGSDRRESRTDTEFPLIRSTGNMPAPAAARAISAAAPSTTSPYTWPSCPDSTLRGTGGSSSRG